MNAFETQLSFKPQLHVCEHERKRLVQFIKSFKLFVLKIKVNFFLLGILVNTVKYIFIVLLETSFIPAISCHLCVSCRHINSILLQNDKQVISAFTLNRTYYMLTNYKHHFYQVYVFSKTIKDIKQQLKSLSSTQLSEVWVTFEGSIRKLQVDSELDMS